MAREGNLEAPTRHPIAWKGPDYYDEAATFSICSHLAHSIRIAMSHP